MQEGVLGVEARFDEAASLGRSRGGTASGYLEAAASQIRSDNQCQGTTRSATPDAGLALGWLGDPRFEQRSGPFGAYLAPPLVAIPGGDDPIGDPRIRRARFSRSWPPVSLHKLGTESPGWRTLSWLSLDLWQAGR